ncbi:MAG: cation:proton antiporter [Rhizobiales bacterium]|nr:monovalent cation:proton antiporter-2 (CPA2) family protein [Hyphomicrobiales bacterium]NRB13622.1 cation:proton antiporter [Hyphomicrobiales bacterium]
MTSLLLQAFIYLCAAVIAVPIAKRLGLGSVLGYLIAGIIIGPATGLVGSETQDIQHFAEFGVVMMLFLVGLELDPKTLWAMRNKLLGLGTFQVAGTAGIVMGFGMWFGLSWSVALAVGLVFSLSSTAIVLQTLKEKNLMKSDGGQNSFSVLLFQDIAVIPMLALIPLLALPELMNTGDAANEAAHSSYSLIDGLAGWQVTLVTIAAIAIVVVGGHYLSRPLFRFIATAKLREVFTAAALLLVIGIAILMTLVGLSPALGTFLAGVVLANSEFRHELESDIEPFKGLLLGLFFITVGAGINFGLLFSEFSTILGLTIGLMGLKALVLLAIAFVFKMRLSDKWLFSLGLAQAGEFGFVLLSFSVQNAVIPVDLADQLLLVVAMSMMLTPALFILFDKVVLPMTNKTQTRKDDIITEKGTAIIAGHGRFGQIINRTLIASGYKTVVIDQQADLIEGMRKFGVQVFYGDATRLDLLHAAGIHEAKLLVVAIDEPEQAIKLIKQARLEHPDIHIVARARDRIEVYRLYYAGANDIVRETFDSAVRASQYALESLGMTRPKAIKQMQKFVEHDRKGLREMAEVWQEDVDNFENKELIDVAKNLNAQLNELMKEDQAELQEELQQAEQVKP